MKKIIVCLLSLFLISCSGKKNSSTESSSSSAYISQSNSTNTQESSSSTNGNVESSSSSDSLISSSSTNTNSSSSSSSINNDIEDYREFDFTDALSYLSSDYLTREIPVNGILFRFDNTHSETPKYQYPIINAARGNGLNYIEIVNDLSIKITKVEYEIAIYSGADEANLDGEYFIGLQYYDKDAKAYVNAQDTINYYDSQSVAISANTNKVRLAFEVDQVGGTNIRFFIQSMKIYGQGIILDDEVIANTILKETAIGYYDEVGFTASATGIEANGVGVKMKETGCYLLTPVFDKVNKATRVSIYIQLNGGTDNQAGKGNKFSVIGLDNNTNAIQTVTKIGIYNSAYEKIDFDFTNINIVQYKLEYTLKNGYGGNYQINTIAIVKTN